METGAEQALITGALLAIFGVVSELVLGSFRHFFDWRWARRRHPIGGDWVKVLGGRVFLVVGLVLIAGSLVASV